MLNSDFFLLPILNNSFFKESNLMRMNLKKKNYLLKKKNSIIKMKINLKLQMS